MIEQVRLFDNKLKNTIVFFPIATTGVSAFLWGIYQICMVLLSAHFFFIVGIIILVLVVRSERKRYRRIKKDIEGQHYAALPVKVEQPERLVLYVHPESNYILRCFALQAQHRKFLSKRKLSIDLEQNSDFQFQEGDNVKLICARHSGLFLLYNQTKSSFIYFENNFFKL